MFCSADDDGATTNVAAVAETALARGALLTSLEFGILLDVGGALLGLGGRGRGGEGDENAEESGGELHGLGSISE